MSDYLDPNNEELLKDFFSEANMQVETLEQNILVLESDGSNHDAVDEIFRAAHTLKGGAATVEMTELAHFTHLIEDALDEIRSGKMQVTEDVVDVLLSCIDIVKAMLEKRMAGEIYEEDISEIEGRLSDLLPKSDKSAKKGAPAPQKPEQAEVQKAAPPAPAPSSAPVQAGAAPKSGAGGLLPHEINELIEVSGGHPIYKISVKFDEAAVMNTVGGIQVYASLKNKGTILKTDPDFDALYGDQFFPTVDYYIASEEDEESLRKFVILPDVSLDASIMQIKHEEEAAAAPAAQPAPAAQAAPAAQPAAAKAESAEVARETGEAKTEEAKGDDKHKKAEHGKAGEAGEDAKKAGKEAGAILRVDSKRIDNLLNLVSETVITKATFNQIATQLSNLSNDMHTFEGRYREKVKVFAENLEEYLDKLKSGSSIKDIRKSVTEDLNNIFATFEDLDSTFKNNMVKYRSTSQILGRITSELQEGVMRIRMVPISQIFSRFPRLVRDLSKSLNKKINLVIEGEDTELDKSVVEDLLDPIMHSVRNSVDHGIEEPEVRLRNGKSETGIITLKAANEGNMIVIEISDDGKGIDVAAIKEKAIERGIIHPNKELTEVEAYNLMFEPGFSTAKTITNISGRGVGLDVVKQQIEKLNGTVTVQSAWGAGTKFTIKLPLTLAIIQGLLVRVGTEIYSIPIVNVIESLRIRPEEIKMIDNNEVFNIRNDVLSLLRLDRLFGIKSMAREDYKFVVIVGSSEKKMGFMVDSLIGEEDVVIKPLRDQYTNSPGIAGASILGDGSVSLIIDVNQLLELGLQKEKESRRLRELAAA